MKTVAYLYPWDVVGDPDAAVRLRDAGVDAVALAAAYHGVRGITSWHPARRVVEARHTAVYVADAAQPRSARATSRALQPLSPSGWAGPDDFLIAADALRGAGLEVRAWCVLTHYDAPNAEAPAESVVSAFGDVYGYALCPSHGDVRSYAADLTRRIAARADVDAFVLEAPGQLGLGHLSLHEKSSGAGLAPWRDRLLSICFCRECSRALSEHGHDPGGVARRVRAALAPESSGPVTVADAVGEEAAGALLAQRRSAASALLAGAISAARAVAPRALAFGLHAMADPWATGPFHAVAGGESDISTYVVPVAPDATTSLQQVGTIVQGATTAPSLAAHVNLTADSPPSTAQLARLAQAVRAEQAAELHLYHLGLIGPAGLHSLTEALRLSAAA